MISNLVVIVVPSEGLKALREDIVYYFNFLVNVLADFFSTSPSVIKHIFFFLFLILFMIVVVKALLVFVRGVNSDVKN